MAFTLKVDPAQPTYFTVKLWGSDVSENRLYLFCEGKQIGYRHLGDVDMLDAGTDQPAYAGRFYYATTPLPLAMTQGKSTLHFEIRSTGRVWGYGTTFEQYQKAMTEPTRGIYRVYTHTDGFFQPPSDEAQGQAPADPPVRQTPGPEVLDTLKTRVNHEVSNNLLDRVTGRRARCPCSFWPAPTPSNGRPRIRTRRSSRRYSKAWTPCLPPIAKTPNWPRPTPATPNPDWFGLGPSGDVLRLLAGPLTPALDAQISDGAGGQITRRAAYAEMLLACRDWHRENRRQYTNQSMINDLYGIYLANRGLQVVAPDKALPEQDARHYLYESIGLQPWLGSEKNGVPTRPLGDHYLQLTGKGLTKELGFVGYYGEVLDWVTLIYDSTRPALDQPGDPQIKAQLVKIAHARAPFRYPLPDSDGSRAMRAETVVGWRDEGHYPGDITYAERPTWDASTLYAAAVTLDPVLVGASQQMFADNQFFASLHDQMQETGFRATMGLLDTPDQYELLRAQPPSPRRLPMTSGGPDFVFADEEDGVLAVKHGDDILYGFPLLAGRATGSTNLARVPLRHAPIRPHCGRAAGRAVRAVRPDFPAARRDQRPGPALAAPLPRRPAFGPRGRRTAHRPDPRRDCVQTRRRKRLRRPGLVLSTALRPVFDRHEQQPGQDFPAAGSGRSHTGDQSNPPAKP